MRAHYHRSVTLRPELRRDLIRSLCAEAGLLEDARPPVPCAESAEEDRELRLLSHEVKRALAGWTFARATS